MMDQLRKYNLAFAESLLPEWERLIEQYGDSLLLVAQAYGNRPNPLLPAEAESMIKKRMLPTRVRSDNRRNGIHNLIRSLIHDGDTTGMVRARIKEASGKEHTSSRISSALYYLKRRGDLRVESRQWYKT